MVRSDAQLRPLGGDATAMVARAAELFLDSLVARSEGIMQEQHRARLAGAGAQARLIPALLYRHVASAAAAWGDRAAFLRDIVPPR